METSVINYLNAMHQAKLMFKEGIIDEKDYSKIEAKMAKKYGLKSTSLLRENELINK